MSEVPLYAVVCCRACGGCYRSRRTGAPQRGRQAGRVRECPLRETGRGRALDNYEAQPSGLDSGLSGNLILDYEARPSGFRVDVTDRAALSRCSEDGEEAVAQDPSQSEIEKDWGGFCTRNASNRATGL